MRSGRECYLLANALTSSELDSSIQQQEECDTAASEFLRVIWDCSQRRLWLPLQQLFLSSMTSPACPPTTTTHTLRNSTALSRFTELSSHNISFTSSMIRTSRLSPSCGS